MRKILVSVLSVAGLLAVVLALATSPASAARSVVTITSDDTAGVYTVSWETAGGCDPGSGTSGSTGSATITVNATNEGTDADGDGSPDLGTLTGTAGTEFVTVNDDCTYKWSSVFIDAASKASCAVTGPPLPTADEDTPAAFTLEVATDTACAPGGVIIVRVGDSSRRTDQGGSDLYADDISGADVATCDDTETPSR